MANGHADSEPSGEMYVKYSVKEILARQDKAAEQRHGEVMREINQLKDRVESLEDDRHGRKAETLMSRRMWTAGVAVAAILINLPVAIVYVGKF